MTDNELNSFYIKQKNNNIAIVTTDPISNLLKTTSISLEDFIRLCELIGKNPTWLIFMRIKI